MPSKYRPRRHAYELMLTPSERSAIDFVGNRYATGDDFYKVLMKAMWYPDDANWDSDRNITFQLEEHEAWAIRELFEEEDYQFPLFSDSFASKLMHFADEIV